MAMFITAVTLLFAVYPAVVEGKCCGPQQWLASMEQISSPPQSMILARMAYDSVNKLVALNATDENGKVISQVLNNYRMNVSYVVINGHCTKDIVLAPFPPRCVPDGAKVVGESYLGAGKSTLHYTSYKYKMYNATVLAAFTKDCIPISQTFYSDRYIGVYHFSGLKTEIKDRSVFDVPAVCKGRANDKNALNMAKRIRRKPNSIGSPHALPIYHKP